MAMSSARSRKIMHDDDTRQRIKAALIINRFTDCLEGKIELSPSQVTCGKALLAKVLPDLQSIAHAGQVNSTVHVITGVPRVGRDS